MSFEPNSEIEMVDLNTATEIAHLSAKYALEIARAEHTNTLVGIQADDEAALVALHIALGASMEASAFMSEGRVLDASFTLNDEGRTKPEIYMPDWWSDRPHLDQIGVIIHVQDKDFDPNSLVQNFINSSHRSLTNADGTSPVLSAHHIIFFMENAANSIAE